MNTLLPMMSRQQRSNGLTSRLRNWHLRRLQIEGAKGICKGKVGHKSKELRPRQAGNSAEVIAYADRSNTRMCSKYYRMLRYGKKKNVAVAAIARELACFVWGIMTNNMEPRTSGKKRPDITSCPSTCQGCFSPPAAAGP